MSTVTGLYFLGWRLVDPLNMVWYNVNGGESGSGHTWIQWAKISRDDSQRLVQEIKRESYFAEVIFHVQTREDFVSKISKRKYYEQYNLPMKVGLPFLPVPVV